MPAELAKMTRKERVGVGALTTPERPYGDEHPGDWYESACQHECRLGCFQRCTDRGACRLEVTPDRASRALSAYYDNRRTIIKTMYSTGKLQVTIRTAPGKNLPQNDPITVWANSLKEPGDHELDPTPYYQMRAENVPVDGPHRLTLASLNARIEDLAPKKGKKT